MKGERIEFCISNFVSPILCLQFCVSNFVSPIWAEAGPARALREAPWSSMTLSRVHASGLSRLRSAGRDFIFDPTLGRNFSKCRDIVFEAP